MRLFSPRIMIGMIGPLLVQLFLAFLYSSIKYQALDTRLFTLFLLFTFPLVLKHVLSPFLLSYIGGFDGRIKKLLNRGLDLVLDEKSELKGGGSNSQASFGIRENNRQSVIEEIKSSLIPLLIKPALSAYHDTFYSRDTEEKEIRSLEYYESLALYSLFSIIFFVTNIIVVFLLKFTSINFFVLELDFITEWSFVIAVASVFAISIVLNYILLRYSVNKIEQYLPYAVPGIFFENPDKSLLRKETIRSLMDYNYDYLVSRGTQKRNRELFDSTKKSILFSILKEEFIIESRKNLALKLAFKEYSLILADKIKEREQKNRKSLLDHVFLGEKLGEHLLFKNHELLGLNSDLIYVRSQITNWRALAKESKEMTYIQLYRLIERLIKQVYFAFAEIETTDVSEATGVNFFDGIKWLQKENILEKNGYGLLNHFRFLRNKVIHEPGTELEVSSQTLIDVLEEIDNMLQKMGRITTKKMTINGQ